jgi:hypothetical protein
MYKKKREYNGELCRVCNKNNATIEHHINYKENKTILVCIPCHLNIHLDEKNIYYPKDKPFIKSILLSLETYEELMSFKESLSKELFADLSFDTAIKAMIYKIISKDIKIKNKSFKDTKFRFIALKKECRKTFIEIREKTKHGMNKKITNSDIIFLLIESFKNKGEIK